MRQTSLGFLFAIACYRLVTCTRIGNSLKSVSIYKYLTILNGNY